MAPRKLLTAKQQAVLDERTRQDDHSESRGFVVNSRLTVWELIARKVSQCEEVYAEDYRTKVRNDPVLNRRLGGLTEQQYLIVCLVGTTSRDGLHAPNTIGDGIFRRFTMNSPLEFALRLSISARYEWAESQWFGSPPGELFRPILHAVAARDFEAAHHLASTYPAVIEKPLDLDYASVYTAVVALLRQDRELLEAAIGKFKKTNPAYVKAINAVMLAVASGSAGDFAEAFKKMLSVYRRYMYDDDLYGLVDPHAHGLYELCRRFSPDVVQEFDAQRKLPWDREYFAWSSEIDNVTEFYETDAIPEIMHPLLLKFEPMPWGIDVRQRW